MRRIGSLQERDAASRFSAILFGRGIDNAVEPADAAYDVWCRDDERLDEARAVLEVFRNDPDDPGWEAKVEAGRQRMEAEAELDARASEHVQDLRGRWAPTGPMGPLTLILIALSVAVAIHTHLGGDDAANQHYLITSVKIAGEKIQWRPGLPEIRAGQVWRLLTPIFLHFGFLHVFFNMWWIKDLGSLIENRIGAGTLAALVVVSGVVSNLAQFYFRHPLFGGMSGVVFALAGFLWMRGKYDLNSGVFLPTRLRNFMLFWLVLCYTGLVGPIANVAHTVGLLAGMAVGYATSGHLRRWLLRE